MRPAPIIPEPLPAVVLRPPEAWASSSSFTKNHLMFFLEGSFGSPLFFCTFARIGAARLVLQYTSLRVHPNSMSVPPEPGGSLVTIQDDCNRRDAGSPLECSRGNGTNGCEPQDYSRRRPGGVPVHRGLVAVFPAHHGAGDRK